MPDTTIRDTARQDGAYNFAYLDEQTKRMIRRAILKAVAVPGYQVPFGGREMPLPYGWGTGGIQVTAAIIGRDDVLKVIDQGADDTTNAVSIRRFFAKVADVATTTHTEEATIIQTRHRMPETPLSDGQILVYQVPIPEPLRMLEPRETETRTLHALSRIRRHAREALRGHRPPRPHRHQTYAYPVMVNGRYIMAPRRSRSSTIPSSTAARRCSSSAPAARSASMPCRPHAGEEPRFRRPSVRDRDLERVLRAVRLQGKLPRRDDRRRRRRRLFVCSDTDYCESRR
jgi:alpha-D-ribose 1-methylphosphonate 5-phosphate C-P lyase